MQFQDWEPCHLSEPTSKRASKLIFKFCYFICVTFFAYVKHHFIQKLIQKISSAELEAARPQTVGEEELQLQLALAMSREEAEQEEQRRRSDDVRLQLALSQSQQDFK